MASSMAQANNEEARPNGRLSAKQAHIAGSGGIDSKPIDIRPHVLIETSKGHDGWPTNAQRGGHPKAPAPRLSSWLALVGLLYPYPLTVS